MALGSPTNRVSFVSKAFAVIACGAVAAVSACSTAPVKLGANTVLQTITDRIK
jgi:hypothetical protein